LNGCFQLDVSLRFGFAMNGFYDVWRPKTKVLLIPDHGSFGILGPDLDMAGERDPFIAAELGEGVLREGLRPRAEVRAFGDDGRQVHSVGQGQEEGASSLIPLAVVIHAPIEALRRCDDLLRVLAHIIDDRPGVGLQAIH
jgi:hypothetical protein